MLSQMVLTDDFVIARRRRALDIYRIADMSFMRKLCVPKAMAGVTTPFE